MLGRPPPPPARQVGHPRPEPPLPSRQPRRGGVGKMGFRAPPPPTRRAIFFPPSDGTGSSGSGSGLASRASQTATDSGVSLLTSVDSGLPSGVAEDSDSVRPTLRLFGQRVLVVYGVWQMFLPTENCLSPMIFLRQTAFHRGWGPLPNLVPNPPKRAAKLAAQVAGKPAARPAAGEPIPVAPVEHVQLFKVKYSRQKNCTPSLLLSRPDMHPCRQFPGHFVVHMPWCSLSCFVSRISCLVIQGLREPSHGIGSLRGVRELSRALTYPLTGQGGGGVHRNAPNGILTQPLWRNPRAPSAPNPMGGQPPHLSTRGGFPP